MAEGARLESVYTATYPGFESPPHRHIRERARTTVRAFFSHVAQPGGVRSPDRGSTTGAASWTGRERSERAARRASAASQSPPHRHILRRARTKVRAFFSYVVQVPSAPLTPALSQGRGRKPAPNATAGTFVPPGPLPRGEGENQRRMQQPAHSFTPALSQGAREKTSAKRNSQHIRSPRPSPKGRGRKPAPNATAGTFVPPRPLPKGAREKTSAELNSEHIRSPRPLPKGARKKPAPNATASTFVHPGPLPRGEGENQRRT